MNLHQAPKENIKVAVSDHIKKELHDSWER